MKKLLVLLMICCMCTACGTKEEAVEVPDQVTETVEDEKEEVTEEVTKEDTEEVTEVSKISPLPCCVSRPIGNDFFPEGPSTNIEKSFSLSNKLLIFFKSSTSILFF